MEDVIAIIMVFSIPIIFMLTRFYLKLQEMKLKEGGDASEWRKDIGNLMAENESLKERVRNLEYLMGEEKRRIDLDYEKEQIRIDRENKI